MKTTSSDSCNVQVCICWGLTFTYKKAVQSQRWPRNAPYIWVPWKFSGLPDYVHGHYSQYFHGLLFRSTLWMFLQNLKSVTLPVAEIIGVPKKFGQSLHTPTLRFLKKNLLMGFYLDRPPVNIPVKFEVRSFTPSWDNRGYSKNLDSPWIRPRSIFS